MQRRPEKELMDEAANAAAYAAADFDEPHNQFITLFQRCFPEIPAAARVLDLGCGAADIMIRFARAFPDCNMDGLDGSKAMLELGRRALKTAGLAGRFRLEQRYLPSADLDCGYDVIISNSLLHHLHNPTALWQSLHLAGTSGTRVFVMDLLRPHTPEQAQNLVETHAGRESEILKQDFYNSLCAAYRIDEVKEQLYEAGLAGLTCKVISDRHFIVHGRLQ